MGTPQRFALCDGGEELEWREEEGEGSSGGEPSLDDPLLAAAPRSQLPLSCRQLSAGPAASRAATNPLVREPGPAAPGGLRGNRL